MEKGRRCDVCDNNVHRASYGKHLRSKNRLKSMREDDIIIPEWFFQEEQEEQEPIRKKTKKIITPKN